MPTDIEVAGIVLGIVGTYPIIISSLNAYAEALKLRSSEHEDQIRALIETFRVQAALFKNSQSILLSGHDISTLRKFGKPDWGAIRDALRSKFTDNFQWQTYIELLKSIHTSWNELGKQIPKFAEKNTVQSFSRKCGLQQPDSADLSRTRFIAPALPFNGKLEAGTAIKDHK
ncbi:hypothetical protein K432DRAFT_388648 [Lepidopterella palustris CBS 459.81]|uniref:Uncharacterized protein n=1 Tax=Lepidopterella palustris CBS 459.81 TaxID=1314670 RepID=A0A8E2EKD9_9PEZI|nr:hypothetical protein K432DRAFT_388648 [Lepidopterella palustris CBS 459.81]